MVAGLSLMDEIGIRAHRPAALLQLAERLQLHRVERQEPVELAHEGTGVHGHGRTGSQEQVMAGPPRSRP